MAKSKRNKIGIRGIREVSRNLGAQIGKHRHVTMRGLLRAASLIRRDMDKTPPLIPVDTGNLRASWYSLPGRIGGAPFVQIGFTADYAVYVHEMDWKKGKRPGSGPKFFESALKRNKERILAIIAEEARKKI